MGRKPLQIVPGVFWVGALDPKRRVISGIARAEGASFNSYFLEGQDPAILDTVPAEFADEFLERVSALVDPAKLKFIILTGAAPERAGALPKLLAAARKVNVVCSRTTGKFLSEILNRKLRVHPVMGKGVELVLAAAGEGTGEVHITPVGDGDNLDLGGMRLEFLPAPLGWPDMSIAYLKQQKALFSGTAFSAGAALQPPLVEDPAGQQAARRRYYNALVGPFREQTLQLLEKLRTIGWEVETVAPACGPAYSRGYDVLLDEYWTWASVRREEKGKKHVAVVYFSSSGNTARMAEMIAEGAGERGAEVALLRVPDSPSAVLKNALESADAIAVGTPTMIHDAPPDLWEALSQLWAAVQRPRPGAVFGSYGWSGEATQLVASRLEVHGIGVAGRILKTLFAPGPADLDACRDLGRNLADAPAPERKGPAAETGG